jgi:transcriptional regulator with XRE-family HTH domain
MDVSNTGRLVATVRGYRGMSQAKLAEKSGVPHSYISTFENGIRSLSPEHLDRLAAALGVDFEAIAPAFDEFARALNGHAAPADADAA